MFRWSHEAYWFTLCSMTTLGDTPGPSSRAHQDETAPIPLEFEVVARRGRSKQDETAPFPLEFMITSPDGEAAIVRVPVVAAAGALPELRWRGVEASRELREYAARIASGEDLPPYRGPILANGASPWVARKAKRPAPPAPANEAARIIELALALMLLLAAVAATAVLGDDVQLRAAGASISRWFTGDRSFQEFPASGSGSTVAPPAAER